jgi:Cu+-exporting ATPase
MAENKKVKLQVEGMTCTNCALGVQKHLEKKGFENIHVDFASGEVVFEAPSDFDEEDVKQGITNLGYKVIEVDELKAKQGLSDIEKKFYFSLLFSVPLFSHMFLPFEFLHNPLVQLALCLPVFILGVLHFGKSAYHSLKSGVPNMDVLIFIGSSAAFFYSLTGVILHYGTPQVHNYLFFETTSTIISLVLLGNVLEHRSVQKTTSAIKELSRLQKSVAKRIIDRNTKTIEEVIFDDIKKGDLLLVNTGDKIPTDGKILEGEGAVNESMLTGESEPIYKKNGDEVIGGTILESGNLIIEAQKVGEETVLSKIINLVKNAQQSKPEIQKLGDKVSAIFVPAVVIISIVTFLVSYFIASVDLTHSILRSVAVLVISCPCAMGLATPTAVMVGIGRAAKQGILIKGGSTLEEFARSKIMVFDKTGTITTGKFKLKSISVLDKSIDENTIISIIYQLEKHSSHPIAKSLVKEFEPKADSAFQLDNIFEVKGAGMQGKYKDDEYYFGKSIIKAEEKGIGLYKNGNHIAQIIIEDEVREGVKEVLQALKNQGLALYLLSGDTEENCRKIAQNLPFDEVYSRKKPDEKLKIITKLKERGKVAMVGDGINDAPALTTADIGISLSDATHIAIQSAQIVLLQGRHLNGLLDAYLISKHTLLTIKQNLFWAFAYNIVAIPIAAVGLLNPMVAALSMAFSDVVVVGNSIRLRAKKLK